LTSYSHFIFSLFYTDEAAPRPIPKDFGEVTSKDPSRKFIEVLGIKILEDQESEFPKKIISKVRLDIVASLNKEDFTDPEDYFKTYEEALATLYNLFFRSGKVALSLYPLSGRWENIQTSQTFSQLAFGGVAQCKSSFFFQ
jgi:hypothetical protein